MNNKICGECRFFESREFICCHSGDDVAAHFIACSDFEPMVEHKLILFDRITVSPEVLAEKLVYDWGHLCHNGDIKIYWKSTILPDAVFYSKSEAFTATVKKLKEVESENG